MNVGKNGKHMTEFKQSSTMYNNKMANLRNEKVKLYWTTISFE